MDLLIFGGQSNMQGQTEGDPMDSPVNGALEYRLLTDDFTELKNPVGEDIGELLLAAHMGGGSLVPYFAEEYVKKTGRNAVAVHAAKGATVIAQWQKTSAEGAARYAKTVEKINAAKEKVGKNFENKPDKIYYIWLQGESDACAKTSKQEYADLLRQFKNDLKKDAGIDRFFIIEVGYFSYIYGGADEYDEAIQAAQRELCETDSDFVYLTDEAKKLSRDSACLNPQAPGHYNNASMKEIGRKAGKAAAEFALKNL